MHKKCMHRLSQIMVAFKSNILFKSKLKNWIYQIVDTKKKKKKCSHHLNSVSERARILNIFMFGSRIAYRIVYSSAQCFRASIERHTFHYRIVYVLFTLSCYAFASHKQAALAFTSWHVSIQWCCDAAHQKWMAKMNRCARIISLLVGFVTVVFVYSNVRITANGK